MDSTMARDEPHCGRNVLGVVAWIPSSGAVAKSAKPGNLSIVVLDNGHFGETGMQVSHSGLGADLAAVAATARFPEVATVSTPDEIPPVQARQQATIGGPRLVRVRIAPGETERALPPRDGVFLKTRFRQALGYAVD